MEAISLSELTLLIKETIDVSFAEFYTIVAEVNQFSVNYSGHAYLQLVEKDPNSNSVIANIRAMIWANKFRMIQAYFQSVTGSEISDGIKIMAKVEVNYHPVYGMGLVIHDIDPAYTLGDIEKRRQEIINQLEEDGIIEMNKSISFPIVPQRIAVISSATAAGYGDFLDHLNNNQFGYKFRHKLFKTVMQGDKTEKSIIDSLDNIFNEIDSFDIVVIIRGGGSKLDLSAFDSYDIALNIAQFPLPILTGIGHQRDLSIADIVSHKSLKTPTAVADFIVSKTNNFDIMLTEKFEHISDIITENISFNENKISLLRNELKSSASEYIHKKQIKLQEEKQFLKFSTNNFLSKKVNKLNESKSTLSLMSKNKISEKIVETEQKYSVLKNNIKHTLITEIGKLNVIKAKLDSHDPQHILNMGFSLTSQNGKIIKSINNLKSGDKIQTQFKDGLIESFIE